MPSMADGSTQPVPVGVMMISALRSKPPTRARLIEAGEAWRPHRSLAARLIWHHYVALQEASRVVGRAAPRRVSQRPPGV